MILIADEACHSSGGHFFTYDREICSGARALGIPFRMFAGSPIDAGVKDALDAAETFRMPAVRGQASTWARFKRVVDYNRAFYRGMAPVLGRYDEANVILLVPSVDERHIFAMVLTALRTRHLAFVLIVRTTLTAGTGRARKWRKSALLLRIGVFLLSPALAKQRAVLCSDSRRIADDLQQLTNRPVTVLPIPHGAPHRAGEPCLPANKTSNALTFLLPGAARGEKGIGVFVRALDLLPPSSDAKFLVQDPRGAPDLTASEALRYFRTLSANQSVELLGAELTTAEYEDALAHADVVLLPYRQPQYESRTSGIAIEALCRGIPVIVTDGTWMADQVRRWNAGLTTADDSPADVAAAIVRMSCDYEQHRNSARCAANSVAAEHNPAEFMSRLCRCVPALASRAYGGADPLFGE